MASSPSTNKWHKANISKPLPVIPKVVSKKPAAPATVTKQSFCTGEPLWKGPVLDGITYSLLSKFLVCRERFRLKAICGIQDRRTWNHKIEYGSMFHTCEENHAQGKNWEESLEKYTTTVLAKYPDKAEDINFWKKVCYNQFREYLTYWQKKEHARTRTQVITEQSFRVPLVIPNGANIILRGKIDSVYLEDGHLWIMEHKTKGRINQKGIAETITQNLQAMMYHVVLECLRHYALTYPKNLHTYLTSVTPKLIDQLKRYPVGGTCYNVIRRPLSDQYAIRQKKDERPYDFLNRIQESIAAEPQNFFYRWYCNITPRDVHEIKNEVVIPNLAALYAWYNALKEANWDPKPLQSKGLHWKMPFGVFNALSAGMDGDYYDYLTKGQTHQLEKFDSLFPELDIDD